MDIEKIRKLSKRFIKCSEPFCSGAMQPPVYIEPIHMDRLKSQSYTEATIWNRQIVNGMVPLYPAAK